MDVLVRQTGMNTNPRTTVLGNVIRLHVSFDRSVFQDNIYIRMPTIHDFLLISVIISGEINESLPSLHNSAFPYVVTITDNLQTNIFLAGRDIDFGLHRFKYNNYLLGAQDFVARFDSNLPD